MQPNFPDTPIIGISGALAESRSVQSMALHVREAGAVPLILANHARRDPTHDIEKLDALIVMGNDHDIDPLEYIHRYPENDPRRKLHPATKNIAEDKYANARAIYEKKIIPLVLAQKMPLFSICGGMQLINVLLGGTLHQHIPDLVGSERHAINAGEQASMPVVHVSIVPGTLLDRIVKNRELQAKGLPPLLAEGGEVNAFHHQAVDILGEGLIASAHSDEYTNHEGKKERLIEAIEASPSGAYNGQFLLGVQWHPEYLPEATDKILRDMQQAALAFAQAQGRVHPPEEIRHENILSALPILENIKQAAKDRTNNHLPSPTNPQGRGR